MSYDHPRVFILEDKNGPFDSKIQTVYKLNARDSIGMLNLNLDIKSPRITHIFAFILF